MPVVFSAEALADLVSIRSYIALNNPSAAARIATEVIAACDRLESFPERGRIGLVEGTRELTVVHPYVIVYRVTAMRVEILKVWHGAQNRTLP